MRLALLLLLALLQGCAREEGVTLSFWAMGREGEVVAQLIPAFERENPGVRVRVQQLPWLSAHEKLLTAFAGDVTPDVAQLGVTWVPELAALGALEPLAARPADKADHFPGLWAANEVDGRLYGMPWYADTRLLFYRRDILARAGYERVPSDWAGWLEALRAVKRVVGPDKYAVLLPLNEFEPLLALAIQQPTPLLREGGRYGAFRSRDFGRTLAFYNRLFDEGLAPRISNTQISNVYDEFARGYFSFYITGPWNIGEFRRRLPPALKDAWATAPLPGPAGPGASTAGGASLVIFRRSPHKAEARRLIAFLSRPATQRRFYELTGDLPPRLSVWAEPPLSTDRHAAAFAAQLTRAKATPAVPEWERIATEMRLVPERLLAGRITVAQAQAELDAAADAILAKRRSLLADAAA